MYRTNFWTLWEKVRVGCHERIALKLYTIKGETDRQPKLDGLIFKSSVGSGL